MKTDQKFDTDKLSAILDGGLCFGQGDGKKTFCVEQAIALCAGLPITDRPDSCVHPVISAFGRRLNDKNWSSEKARANGMREFAFAQLGTVDIDAKKWIKRVAELTIRDIVPFALRAAAKVKPAFADELENSAKRCEQEGTELAAREAQRSAASDASSAADYSVYAAAYSAYAAASAASSAAAYSVYAAAYSASSAAAYSAASSAAAYSASDAAAYSAYAAAYSASDAAAYSAYAAANSAEKDKILSLSTNIAARAIREQTA